MSSPPGMPQLTAEELASAAQDVIATKYYLCAAFTILLYDHMLSFSDEVEHIWVRKRELVSAVFLFNRYYAPAALTVTMTAFFDTSWSAEACKKFAPFDAFGVGIPLIALPGVLLVLRVYALYSRSLLVLLFLGALLAAQVIVGIWVFAFPGGGPVQFPTVDPNVFHICLYTAAPSLGQAAGAYLGVDLAFDICVFVLTMVKAGQTLVHRRGPALLRRISQDGAIYFFVIFSSNAVWFFMVLFATPELKYINALPATILDVTMINRLTMNLRSNSEQGLIGETGNRSVSTPVFACCGPRTAKHSHGTRSYGTSVSGPSDSMSGSYELGAIRSERQAKA